MENCTKCKNFQDFISLMNDYLSMCDQLIINKRRDLFVYTQSGERLEIINKLRHNIHQMEINLMNRQAIVAQMYCDYGDHLIHDHDEEY